MAERTPDRWAVADLVASIAAIGVGLGAAIAALPGQRLAPLAILAPGLGAAWGRSRWGRAGFGWVVGGIGGGVAYCALAATAMVGGLVAGWKPADGPAFARLAIFSACLPAVGLALGATAAVVARLLAGARS